VKRSESMIDLREADHAGTAQLSNPTSAATSRHSAPTDTGISSAFKSTKVVGDWRSAPQIRLASPRPITPPMRAMVTASARMMPRAVLI
jgi:hypothetical protein